MQRREFLTTCALLSGAGFLAGEGARADAPPRWYARTHLTDIHGRPIRARDLAADTNYVFQYPFAATPCLLIKLSRPAIIPANLRREDGTEYAWRGGVGAE